MEPLSGPLPHGLMGLPTSPIPDTSRLPFDIDDLGSDCLIADAVVGIV